MTWIMGFQILDIKKQTLFFFLTQEFFSVMYSAGQALSPPLMWTQDTNLVGNKGTLFWFQKLHRWVIIPKLKLKLLFTAARSR